MLDSRMTSRMTRALTSNDVANDEIANDVANDEGADATSTVVAQCEKHCEKLSTLVKGLDAVLAFERTAGSHPKSTVGLTVRDDGVITNMLTAAPAYMCKQLKKGDKIVQINGKPVEEGTDLTTLLLGSDIPGSLVSIRVLRDGFATVDVTLLRACTTDLADKRHMFQLFTTIKDLALQAQCPTLTSVVDEAIDLWTGILESTCGHEDSIITNLLNQQQQADHSLHLLRRSISALSDTTIEAMIQRQADAASMRALAADMQGYQTKCKALSAMHAALQTELSVCKEAQAASEEALCRALRDWEELQAQHAPCESNILTLTRQTKMLQEKLDASYADLQVSGKPHRHAQDVCTTCAQQECTSNERKHAHMQGGTGRVSGD